jgi:hypothetical protein
MADLSYPAQNIHLPPHPPSLHAVQLVSHLGAGITLLAALLLIYDMLSGSKLFPMLSNMPTIIGFMASGLSIFLYRISTKFQFLGILCMIIGLTTILNENIFAGTLAIASAGTLKSGILFLIIGLSILSSILPIPHRYHFMQVIAFTAISISLFSLLESLYRYISLGYLTGDVQYAIWSSLFFFILSQSIFWMKPGRGFVGIFMCDNLSSKLSRMSLIYFTTMPPLFGFFLILSERIHFLDSSGRLALLIVIVIIICIISTWINIRLLYPSAVEHFLMKEALRVNNISLEMNASDLTTKVDELEKAKQEVTRKFNNQQTLTDIMDQS